MNWESYWRIKKKHKRKASCSWFSLFEIDSFTMFKNKSGLEWVRNSEDRIMFEVYQYDLKAELMPDDSLNVSYGAATYRICVEKKPCNYGGFYSFFRCPQCDKRMRKLYCIQGRYLCRKCGNLGYYSQRLRPSDRLLYMKINIKDSLANSAGALDSKPPWIKQYSFQKIRKKYLDYDQKYFYAKGKEFKDWFGPIDSDLDGPHSFFVPSGFDELYDYDGDEGR